MSKILVECMQGIGDQIYSRPFIKKLSKSHDVYIRTVIPALFSDLDVSFVKPSKINYRTQQKAFTEEKVFFVDEPVVDRTINFHYGRVELKAHGIVSHMERAFGFDPSPKIEFDLPFWSEEERVVKNKFLSQGKPVAIVRPPTVRKEWICKTRNPNPNYVNWCARILRDAGYYVVSIADVEEGKEWLEDEPPPADVYLHKGELGLKGTLTLIKRSSIVVGGSGFIIPASVAANTRLFVIFGGRGEYDNPHKVFDLRMDLKKIGWALPDNFCRCNQMEHDCDKTISQLDSEFFRFMSR